MEFEIKTEALTNVNKPYSAAEAAFKTDKTITGASFAELADELKRQAEKLKRQTDELNRQAEEMSAWLRRAVRTARSNAMFAKEQEAMYHKTLEENTRLKKRERELVEELEEAKNKSFANACASLAAQKTIRDIIDEAITWGEEHLDPSPQERAPYKLMYLSVFGKWMTKEQRQRLEDFDKRDKGTRATTINVSGGGQYIERVDRQEAAPRWRMMR